MMMKKTLSTLAALGIVMGVESAAHAFTTGGHFTATERGLRRAGFDTNGIRHVQAANYGVDHMVNIPDAIMPADSIFQRAKNVTRFFHSDGLWHIGYVERELAFVDAAVKSVVLSAKARRDPQTILHVLGIASHAIQDFYSHANFADIDWQAYKGTRIVTMDDVPRDLWESPLISGRWSEPSDVRRLLTGQPSVGGPYGNAPEPAYPHHGSSTKECSPSDGQKDCGVNHDGARRRNNLVAIMMAAEATFDLAERARLLVSDAQLWAQVQHPGASNGVNHALERAQAMSMAAGQWGYERSESYVQIAIAFASTSSITSFDVDWQRTLFAMWTAAPTAHAMGGGADPFPPNNVTLFGLPQPHSPANAASFVGSYSVLWGQRRGGLELSTGQGLTAVLTLDNQQYRQVFTRERADGGIELVLRQSTAPTVVLTGTVYVTGPNRDLAGYLRDGAAGTPDGFVATKRRFNNVTPVRPDSVKAL